MTNYSVGEGKLGVTLITGEGGVEGAADNKCGERRGSRLKTLRPPRQENYFGTATEPVTVKRASDLASVSCGWAPPSVRVYLPARIERLP